MKLLQEATQRASEERALRQRFEVECEQLRARVGELEVEVKNKRRKPAVRKGKAAVGNDPNRSDDKKWCVRMVD